MEQDQNIYKICGIPFVLDSKYTPVKALGVGAYGVVCSAKLDLPNGRSLDVAVKKISSAFKNAEEGKRLLREIKLMKHFNHENIIGLIEILRPRTYEQFDDVYIATELMDTDLGQIIKSSQPLSNEHVQYFIYQILRGLLYIHSANVVHRDLKPSNILVNANCDARICDFGLSRPIDVKSYYAPYRTEQHLTHYVTTRWYRAPEVLLCDSYSKPIDIWSCGCILAELILRKPLFPGENHWLQLPMITSVIGSPDEDELSFLENPQALKFIKKLPQVPKKDISTHFPDADPLAIDLLKRMLQFDPRRRCTVEQALAHPYLASLHDPQDEPICPRPYLFDIESGSTPETVKDMVFREMMDFHREYARELEILRVHGLAESFKSLKINLSKKKTSKLQSSQPSSQHQSQLNQQSSQLSKSNTLQTDENQESEIGSQSGESEYSSGSTSSSTSSSSSSDVSDNN